MAWGGGVPAVGPEDTQLLQDPPSCTVDIVMTGRQASHDASASNALAAAGQPYVKLKVCGAALCEA